MTGSDASPSREDVLSAFAVEYDSDEDVLQRYIQAYPRLAAELLQLADEILKLHAGDLRSLTSRDLEMIERVAADHCADAERPGSGANSKKF